MFVLPLRHRRSELTHPYLMQMTVMVLGTTEESLPTAPVAPATAMMPPPPAVPMATTSTLTVVNTVPVQQPVAAQPSAVDAGASDVDADGDVDVEVDVDGQAVRFSVPVHVLGRMIDVGLPRSSRLDWLTSSASSHSMYADSWHALIRLWFRKSRSLKMLGIFMRCQCCRWWIGAECERARHVGGQKQVENAMHDPFCMRCASPWQGSLSLSFLRLHRVICGCRLG